MSTLQQHLAKYPPAPRYTSYPTTPHFYALEPGTRAQWLSEMNSDPVSLYVHIPYCQKLCWFCGCHTRITQRYEPVNRYLQAIYEESSLLRDALGRRQEVKHIHWGGGSPSMLRPEDFVSLMSHLSNDFTIRPDAEIAIELDPRGVNEAKMAAYALAGVNRISLGVQDFCPEVQAAINRQQPFHTVYRTVEMARSYGISAISMDLVYGLPKQTLEGFQETVEKILYLQPQRIALFGYAHVPWVKRAMRLIDETTLPDAFLRQTMFSAAAQQLKDAGYVQLGLDHFALADDPMTIAAQAGALKRNFQGYTTDNATSLIGMGASAISHLPQGYVQNPVKIEAYMESLASHHLPQHKGFALSAEDRLRRAIIEALMCRLEIDVKALCTQFGMNVVVVADAMKKLQPLIADQLISLNNNVIAVHPHVPQAVRLACAAFDCYYQPTASQRHAQVA